MPQPLHDTIPHPISTAKQTQHPKLIYLPGLQILHSLNLQLPLPAIPPPPPRAQTSHNPLRLGSPQHHGPRNLPLPLTGPHKPNPRGPHRAPHRHNPVTDLLRPNTRAHRRRRDYNQQQSLRLPDPRRHNHPPRAVGFLLVHASRERGRVWVHLGLDFQYVVVLRRDLVGDFRQQRGENFQNDGGRQEDGEFSFW